MTTEPREMMACPACEGRGMRAVHVCATCPQRIMPCPTCGGTGVIPVPIHARDNR